MIDVNKAQSLILQTLEAEIMQEEINREGTYILFDNIEILNHASVEYHFSVFVAIALFNRDKTVIYEPLSSSLNQINTTADIELLTCKPISRDGNLLTYQLRIKTKIVGMRDD